MDTRPTFMRILVVDWDCQIKCLSYGTIWYVYNIPLRIYGYEANMEHPLGECEHVTEYERERGGGEIYCIYIYIVIKT